MHVRSACGLRNLAGNGMTETNRIFEAAIDNPTEGAVAHDIEQERKVAIYDLCAGNTFAIVPRGGRQPPVGPYKLLLRLGENHAVFDIRTETGNEILAIHMSMTQFQELLKSYGSVCRQYFDAVRSRPRDVIEQTDRIRRVIHDQGAERLLERLSGKIETDSDTARRLFTLLFAAQPNR